MSYTRYCVMGDPPVDEGAIQERETCALPDVATRNWGGEEVVSAKFSTFTVVDAVEVLLEVSVEIAQRVVEPFAADAVFQGMEYRVVLLGVEVEPMIVLEAKLAP